ncbi:BspA family leucine-rich repeat surface protein [bacterium]|nr:BspA family leucine-rich repeat surface protein [bacterium]
MFADKPNLEKINFENSEINGDMYMKEMFKDTTKLKELDLTSWDTSKITNMNSMFK